MNRRRPADILSGRDRSVSANLIRAGLSVLSPGYRLGATIRNAAFDTGFRRPKRLDRPVISVGNITTGGTGKTPMVIELVRRLVGQGRRPAVLLRGYRAGVAGSDEAILLAEALGATVPVHANPDRCAAALKVTEQHPQVDIFILDDGFQHRQVRRDLDLVLIDATEPFGFDRLLPRGLLREPLGSLRRAGAVIVTKADAVGDDQRVRIDQRIATVAGQAPIAHTAHRWLAWLDGQDKQHRLSHLAGKMVLGVCGIGNPTAFEATLRAVTRTDARAITFNDHHPYTAGDLEAILTEARRCRAEAVVTTAKDWVKWKSRQSSSSSVPIYRPQMQIEFIDGADAVERLLASVEGNGA